MGLNRSGGILWTRWWENEKTGKIMNMKFALNSWLLACLLCMFAACSDSDEIIPDESVKIILDTSPLKLGSRETGTLRFSVSPWNASWNISQVSLVAMGGATLPEGCTITGLGNFGDGHFAVYVTDDGTAAGYAGEVCLSIAIEGKPYISGTFGLQSTTEGRSSLPVIRVTSSAPIVDKDNWIDGTIEIDGKGLGDLPLMKTKVKGRGNSTWLWEKKPYALKFSSKTEVLGMPKHKRWCLIANYMDKTLMRNRIAYYIGDHTGLGWTPRTRFAEVYLNGEYLGNYLVVEQIKIDENRLHIDEMAAEDNEGDALTGGYLLELDSYFDEVNKFRSVGSDMPVNIKSPDENISYRQYNYIRRYFDEADRLLFDKNFQDPSPMFDFDSFIDYWIVNELMGNSELKHPKSFYIHKPRLGKLTAGPIWDFDYGTLTFAYAEQWQVRNNNLWLTRMLSSQAVRKRAKERWQALYPFLQTVPEYIEQQRAYIAESAARNFARWPEIKTEQPNGDEALTFDEAVSRLKESYKVRLAWLDAEIEKW